MKKHRLKTYLKLGILLFGISICCLTCQKDDSFSNEESSQQLEFKVNLINKSKIANNASINTIVKALPNKNDMGNNTNLQARGTYIKEYDFYVDDETAYHIIYGNYESYTFAINRDQDNGLVENLLLSKQADGSYKASIVSYNLDEADKESIKGGNLPVDIAGKTTLSRLGNGCNGCYILQREDGSCYWNDVDAISQEGVIKVTEVEIPCPEHLTNSVTEDGSGGAGSTGTDPDGTNTDNGTSTDSGAGTDNPNTGNGTDPNNPFGGLLGGGNTNTDNDSTNNSNTDADNSGTDTSNENSDCLQLDENGNCISDATIPLIIENSDDPDCQNTISGLTEIINTPEIKAELNRLKFNMGFSAKEDGKRFIYTGPDPSNPATYNDANFDEILPTGKFPSSLDFPPLQNNTLVGAHFHPFAGIDGKPIRQVPSGTDIAEHINMIKKVYTTNPNAANQVTNFVVYKGNSGRTYILRANNAQNIVNNTLDYNIQKNRDDIRDKVEELIKPFRYDAYDEHEKAFNSFLSENFPDLDVLKAEYDANGNITKFCKLKTQQ